MQTKLIKIGDSVAVLIPDSLLKGGNLAAILTPIVKRNIIYSFG